MGRKKINRKRRTISVSFKAAHPFNQFRTDPATGRMETLLDGVVVPGISDGYVTVTYEGENKTRTITTIPQPTGIAIVSPYSFIDNFDVIFAIDTNTRAIGTKRVSFGVMAFLELRQIERYPSGAISKVELHLNLFKLLSGENIPGNPEPWFWRVGIEDAIKKSYVKYSDALRIGLVVDSDLGNHARYNAGEIPLHENYFLPSNIKLIYAGSEGGSDYVLNKLLRYCDAEAKLQLDAIERGEPVTQTLSRIEGAQELAVPTTPFRFYSDEGD